MLGVPGFAFLTSGAGEGDHHTAALDAALRDAGIGDANLVEVSSVLPPGCELVDRREPETGELLPCVLAKDMGEGYLEASVATAVSEGGGMVAEAVGRGSGERAAAAAREMMEGRGLDPLDVYVETRGLEFGGTGAAVAALVFGIDF